MIAPASFTWRSMAALAIVGTIAPDDGGMVAWAMKAIFGLMLGIIAYFVKQIADQMKENQRAQERHERILKRHQLVINYFINHASAEVEQRGEAVPGRRKSDAALLALFEAIKADGDSDA